MFDGSIGGQAGVGSAEVLTDVRVAHREALDVGLVDDRVGERDPRRPVALPVEGVVDDDGLDLFNMTPATTVVSNTVTYPASAQNTFLSGSIEDINTGLTDHPTRVRVEMKPVNGGPFETPYAIECSALMIPRTIDLEAPSA